MRVPLAGVVAGTLVAALGVAGFVRGAVPQHSTSSVPARVTVIGATVTASSAASTSGMFTVVNTTSGADRVTEVASGAGATVRVVGDAVIPAGATRVVRIVITALFGRVAAGESVDLQVSFRTAPAALVTARVAAQAGQAQSPQPSSGGSS